MKGVVEQRADIVISSYDGNMTNNVDDNNKNNILYVDIKRMWNMKCRPYFKLPQQ
jgi:hypothetical protein